MEKNLLKTLITAAIIMTVAICLFGFIYTGIVLFYIGLTLFLFGLMYILYKSLKDAINEKRRSVTLKQAIDDLGIHSEQEEA